MAIFSLNATLIAEIILFAVVVAVVHRLVLPPLRQAMSDRQSAIEKGLADAEAAEARLTQADLEYQRQVGAAKSEARRILETYRAMGATIEAEARERGRVHLP